MKEHKNCKWYQENYMPKEEPEVKSIWDYSGMVFSTSYYDNTSTNMFRMYHTLANY